MQYSTPGTGGRQAKEDLHYENTDLYENMPSPRLATRYPPPPSSASSSSHSHYKSPVNKVSSKFLASDAKAKDAAQVTFFPTFFPSTCVTPCPFKIKRASTSLGSFIVPLLGPISERHNRQHRAWLTKRVLECVRVI